MSPKKDNEPFAAVLGLRNTGRTELSGEESPETAPVPATPAPSPADLVLLSARIPRDLKHEYDDHIIELRRSRSILNQTQSQIGMAALVRLLRDPKIKQRWHEELERMFDEDYQRKRRR